MASPHRDDARFWDRLARKYAADQIADPAGYERTLEATRRLLKSTDTVLELGCGTGTTALALAPAVAQLVASDLSGEMIAIAREKASSANLANVSFEVATLQSGPWANGSFDAVLAFNVLHLVRTWREDFAAIHRLLKPGGVFVSKTPCLKEINFAIRLAVPAMQAVGRAPYVAFFSAKELEAAIAEAGFEMLERARHGSRRKDARIFLAVRKA